MVAAFTLGALAATAVVTVGVTASAAPAGATLGDGLEPMISTSIALGTNPLDPNATVKVTSLAKLANTLYVGGQFTQIAPERLPVTSLPAGAGIPRPYLFAVDATTGNPVWSFAPVLDGAVYALEVDPATNTLYVGGRFSTVNGQALSNFAILDAATGALKDGVTQLPVTGGSSHIVRTLYRHASSGKLYIGGDFTNVGGRNRGEVARISLPGNTVDNWKVSVNGAVLAFGVDQANPAPERVYVGGEFTAVGGDANFGYIAAFDSTEPAAAGDFAPPVTTWDPALAGNDPPRVRAIAVAGGNVYAAMGGAGGRFFVWTQADPAAQVVGWRTDGDVQIVHPVGNQVLVGGHFTRFYNRPDPLTGASITLRCQMFAVAVDDPTNLLPSPNLLNSAHYGPFAAVAEDTNNDGAPDDTYWGGQLGRLTQGADPTPLPFNPDAGQGQCGTGLQGPWGGLLHLRETPVGDTTKPLAPGPVNVTGSFTTAGVSWPPASDASGIAAYYLYVNGSLAKVVAGDVTSTTLTGFQANSVNTIKVRAFDPATNYRDFPSVTWTAPRGLPALPNPLKGFGLFNPTPNPVRIFDTRNAIGRPGTQPVPAGTAVPVAVVGQAGVPPDAELVAMNVTAVNPTGHGFLTVWPNGEPLPNTSNLNFAPGQTVPNLVVARLGTGGKVNVQVSAGTAHVLVDVVGWFGSGSTTVPGARLLTQTPERKLDTRNGIGVVAGPVGPGATVAVQVVPPGSGVTGVVMNLTGLESTAATFVTAYPGDKPLPNVSNLNLVPGQVRPNLVMVAVAPDGTVKLTNAFGKVQLLVDVVATFTATTALDNDTAGRVIALDSPQRFVDTRQSGEALGGPNDSTRDLAALDQATPPTVKGVVMNVTATQATALTYLTLYPADVGRPNASNLNVRPGEDVPNLAVSALSPDGLVKIYNNSGAVNYIFDVTAAVLG